MLKGVNFIELKAGLPWENAFLVIDTPNEIGIELIESIHIAANYRVYVHKGQQYKVVFYKFKAKHREKLLQAVSEITNKALVCGYKDYENFCNEMIFKILKESGNKL